MNRSGMDKIIEAAPWFIAAVLVAGMVHIVSVLAMPKLASKDAFARMQAMGPPFRLTLLPATTSGAVGPPFDDPALAQGVCLYNLDKGSLRLRADLSADALTLVSFQNRYGQIYYSMTDRSATRGKLDVLVLTPAQLEALEADDSEDELPQELRIVSPTSTGFVLVRAFAETPGAMAGARARVASVDCRLESKPAP